MSITISNPSIVHTFGNVACVAINYIESFFPENFFTKTHIATKMAHRQLDPFRARTGFWKNKKPMLVLRPRIDFGGSSNWFYGSTMMTRVTHSDSPMEFCDLVEVMHDDENRVSVQYIWNRYKVLYDISIIIDTYNQQVNIMNDLRNRLNIDWPYRNNTLLEAYIPKSVIYAIADQVGISRDDTPTLLDYLNTISEVPITYKLHKSSGRQEFFMLYPTRVEIFSSDLTPDDGETRGIIADTYTITLTLSIEFNAVGVWYLFMDDGRQERIHAPMDEICTMSGDNIIPISSIPLNYDLDLTGGWKILESPFYFPDMANKEGVDSTDISSILDKPSIKMLIRHNREMGIPLEQFLNFRCFCENREIPRGHDGFDISFEDKCIYTYYPIPKTSYRLFVLINSLAINNMATEITNFNKS